MKIVLLMVATLIVQVAFGWPGAPAWLSMVLLPMAFIVAPPMLLAESRWPHFALLLGLLWDLLLEPVVGPGAIAWSAAAVVLFILVPLVADRSPRAWLAFGALGTVVLVSVRNLALIPLGLATDLTIRSLLLSALLTSVWCGLVGWIIAMDLPARWRSHRARKLR
jgi:hypothetical protein